MCHLSPHRIKSELIFHFKYKRKRVKQLSSPVFWICFRGLDLVKGAFSLGVSIGLLSVTFCYGGSSGCVGRSWRSLGVAAADLEGSGFFGGEAVSCGLLASFMFNCFVSFLLLSCTGSGPQLLALW